MLATVVRLLEVTLIRVGNAEYARTNNSFGLTTMQDGHVDFDGAVGEARGCLTALRPEEAAVLAFLRARLAREQQPRAA